MIELILLERVENLGQMGQVVKVRPGFARNFLLPQKKALRATKDNLAFFEKQRTQLEAQNLKKKGEAEQVAGKLEGVHVVVIRQAGESGQLYGSVSARDIADAVTAAGFTVGRSQIVLDKPIKSLGLYKTRVVLHPEVSATVTANVAQSPEEAEMQKQGVDPLSLARAAAEREAAERDAAVEVVEEAAPAAEAAPEKADAEAAPAAEEKPKAKRAKKAKAEK
jgi:large subunit ribosomal protein L9